MPEKKKKTAILILAAGRGSRMRSGDFPKVLTPLAGEPILFPIIDGVLGLEGIDLEIGLILGKGGAEVQEALADRFPGQSFHYIEQPEPRGTGDAVRKGLESPIGQKWIQNKTPVLVIPGDQPLMTTPLFEAMVQPLKKGTALRMATCQVPDPTGYGRIVRKKTSVQKIVEHRDASPKELQINEIATSTFFFDSGFLWSAIQKLSSKNAQGEYYLTDVVAAATKKKKKIDVLRWNEYRDLLGVNNPWEWSQAAKIYNQRILRKWAQSGVRFWDPDSTWVDRSVEIELDTEIHPGAILKGKTRLASGVSVGPRSVLENVEVGEGTEIKTGTVALDSSIGKNAKIGPYAHLRPSSEIGDEAKIGNYVEVKKSKIGRKTSVAHLSYVGDAEIGDRVNIGCGFVTCNFDGRVIDGQRKHKTIIEDDVFMGSDCQTVAPVRVGAGSYIASGSTLTQDVDPDSLAIARSRQVVKKGYAKKFRGESETAEEKPQPEMQPPRGDL